MNTANPAPMRIPRTAPIAGTPMPKPTPNPAATQPVIDPAAFTLGLRHLSNVGAEASESRVPSARLMALRKPIKSTGLSRLLTFCSVLPGARLPVWTMSMM